MLRFVYFTENDTFIENAHASIKLSQKRLLRSEAKNIAGVSNPAINTAIG